MNCDSDFKKISRHNTEATYEQEVTTSPWIIVCVFVG